MTLSTQRHASTRYVFSISRFHCGCIYRRSTDRIYFCPVHRGILTGEETIRLPDGMTGGRGDQPKILRLAMSEFNPHWPDVVYNTERNSLSQTNQITARGEEWHTWTDETGLCAACFIDGEDVVPTGAAMCECGNRDCVYRWCGRNDGLHAYWMLHAAGITKETTGVDDRDIFAYGPFNDQPAEVTRVLDDEREYLNKSAAERARIMTDSRTLLPPWLDALRHTAARHPQKLHEAAVRLQVIEEAPLRRNSHNQSPVEPGGLNQSAMDV